jgi:hypothetical protein
MTSMSNKGMTMAELERLLEVYGADRARWPAEVRAAAAQVVAASAEARRLLAEAEALDRVLERAPVPGLAAEVALAERIVAAAQRSPRIVALPGAHRSAEEASPGEAALVLARAAGASRRRQRPSGPGRWGPRLLSREMGAAGLLAASLAMGVVIGNLSLPPQLLPALADMAGLGPSRDSLVKIAIYEEDLQ